MRIYRPVAKGGVSINGHPGPLSPYDEAFSRDANQTYYQAMAIPDDDDPDLDARTLVVVIGEFADGDSAASGFADVVDLLAQTPDYPQSARPPEVGDEARAFRGEFTDPADGRIYQELRFVFRTGRFLADLVIYDYLDDAPAPSALMPVAERLAERLDDAEAAGSPGLALQVVRIASPALTTFYDNYIRRGGDQIRYFGVLTSSMQTDDEFFDDLGVTDGYYYLSAVHPSEETENETYANLEVELLLFTDSRTAASFLETAADEWIEGRGAEYQDMKRLDDAEELGDDSAVVSFRQETIFGERSNGYRVWVRTGNRVAIVEFDGVPEIPLPVAQSVVEAQLACFDAGTCPEPVPLSELRQAVPTEAIVTQSETPTPLTPPSTDAAAQATIAAQATRIAILEAPTSTPDAAAQATIAAQATRIAALESTRTPPTIPPTNTPIPPTTTPVPTSTPDPAQATIAAQAARIATLEATTPLAPTATASPPAEPVPPGTVAPTLQDVCTVPGTATGITYAEAVVAYDPRNPAGPSAEPNPEFRDPERVLGPPDADPVSFLGALSLGAGGSLTLQFGDTALVGDGTAAPELWVCEVGPPDAEGAFVAVSTDGLTWSELGRVGGGTSALDLDALGPEAAGVRFVRLTDDPVPDPGRLRQSRVGYRRGRSDRDGGGGQPIRHAVCRSGGSAPA